MGGGSRIKRPTGHPSNPIEQQSKKQSVKQSQIETQKPDNHETLKAGVFITAAVSAFLILKSFNHENRDSEDEKPGILSEGADH